MVRIKRTVRMQQLHYPLSKSCMGSTARNFDSVVTIICICLDMGQKSNEFEFSRFPSIVFVEKAIQV